MKIISFDGLAVSQYELDEDIPLEFRSNLVRLPGVPGAFDADGDGQAREPLTITRNFELVESSYAAVDATLDALRKKANLGLKTLVVEMRDGSQRATPAKLKRVKAPMKPEYLLHSPVEMTFEVPWPWFEELTATTTTQNGDGNFSINNTGGDRIIKGLITITGPSVDPLILNNTTGEFIQYTGTISGGSELVIDLGAYTALLDSVAAWANVSIGAQQTRLFSLAVGLNDIDFSGGGIWR